MAAKKNEWRTPYRPSEKIEPVPRKSAGQSDAASCTAILIFFYAIMKNFGLPDWSMIIVAALLTAWCVRIKTDIYNDLVTHWNRKIDDEQRKIDSTDG